jgi:hypothetical protein
VEWHSGNISIDNRLSDYVDNRRIHAYLCKKTVHFTACADWMVVQLAVMFVAQKIIAKERVVDERLEYNIEETGLAKVEQTSSP